MYQGICDLWNGRKIYISGDGEKVDLIFPGEIGTCELSKEDTLYLISHLAQAAAQDEG